MHYQNQACAHLFVPLFSVMSSSLGFILHINFDATTPSKHKLFFFFWCMLNIIFYLHTNFFLFWCVLDIIFYLHMIYFSFLVYVEHDIVIFLSFFSFFGVC